MSSGIQAFNEGYIKTVWETGDVITAEKLNNMETGIESNQRLVVTITQDGGEFSADKTFSEIVSAITAGKEVVASYIDNGVTSFYYLAACGTINDNEFVSFKNSTAILDDGVESTIIDFNADGTIVFSYDTYPSDGD